MISITNSKFRDPDIISKSWAMYKQCYMLHGSLFTVHAKGWLCFPVRNSLSSVFFSGKNALYNTKFCLWKIWQSKLNVCIVNFLNMQTRELSDVFRFLTASGKLYTKFYSKIIFMKTRPIREKKKGLAPVFMACCLATMCQVF